MGHQQTWALLSTLDASSSHTLLPGPISLIKFTSKKFSGCPILSLSIKHSSITHTCNKQGCWPYGQNLPSSFWEVILSSSIILTVEDEIAYRAAVLWGVVPHALALWNVASYRVVLCICVYLFCPWMRYGLSYLGLSNFTVPNVSSILSKIIQLLTLFWKAGCVL